MRLVGSVVISIDAELAWGFHHLDEIPEKRIEQGRSAWHRLVCSFDEFDVPATWAVTGHLLQRRCSTTHVGHPAGERVCTTEGGRLSADELWFGSDLIEAVRSSRVTHEIASHGHTHLHFNHPLMNRRVARSELKSSVEAAMTWNFDLTTFVHPVNEIGYRDLLDEFGFDTYRGVSPATLEYGGLATKVRKLSRALTGRPAPPLVDPHIDEYGLVNVPASLYLYTLSGPIRSGLTAVGRDPLVTQATAGVDRAAEGDGVFHMWLHPHNAHSEVDFAGIRRVLQQIAYRRKSHDLRVETMGEVAERVRAEARR
ncbi:MAG: polysaccharide deacetylase family protein [Halobacteriota archaeon]